jgi:hypothetical protein
MKYAIRIADRTETRIVDRLGRTDLQFPYDNMTKARSAMRVFRGRPAFAGKALSLVRVRRNRVLEG